jgi:hypothetical protein
MLEFEEDVEKISYTLNLLLEDETDDETDCIERIVETAEELWVPTARRHSY